MKIGISTASFFTKELTEDTFSVMEDLRIEICEVFLTTFFEYEESFAKKLLKYKKDIEVYSVHTLNVQFEPELFNPVFRTRNDSEQIFKKVATSAKTLGAKYYTFHGPTRMKRTPYIIDYARVGKRVGELNSLLYSLGGGCRLAYENVHWTFFNSPEYFLQLSKHCAVNTCLDIKQAMQSQISVYDYIDAMGNNLVNVHVCDFDSDGRLYMPGKGTFNFVDFFQKLYDIGYNGPIIMELYANNYKNYDEIKYGYEYLQECKDKINK